MENLHNKVALITGAARRIGAEIACSLHQNGLNVVLHYNHSHAEAEKLAAKLNAIRENSAVIVRADLSHQLNAHSLMDEALKTWGRLDVLVNNASQFFKTKIGAVTESIWNELLDTNLKAPFFLSQAAVPYLAKHQGCIINIGDIHGDRPMKDYPVYSISKAGLIMMTKALAKELGESIRVNAVSPGPVAWPEEENELSEALKQSLIDRTALKKAGSAAEIAKAVIYFVRDADYVTGQVLVVDAGRSLFM